MRWMTWQYQSGLTPHCADRALRRILEAWVPREPRQRAELQDEAAHRRHVSLRHLAEGSYRTSTRTEVGEVLVLAFRVNDNADARSRFVNSNIGRVLFINDPPASPRRTPVFRLTHAYGIPVL